MDIELISLKLNNIRGFTHAELDLTKNPLLIVGENNSGKSAALIILDWIFNGLDTPAHTVALLQPQEKDWRILQPARDTGHQARRITLKVRFKDGRTARTFKSEGGRYVHLRFDLRQTPEPKLLLKLGLPKKSDKKFSEQKAFDLLKRLRRIYQFEYIPAFRDAASSKFVSSLQETMRDKLSEIATHRSQSGAPRDYRSINLVKNKLQGVGNNLLSPVLKEITKSIPAGLIASASPSLEIDNADIVDWMAENVKLKLSTGSHDTEQVYATSVGSGLQSLLALALRRGAADNERRLILALDEPEAFLHPAAQRTMARQLFKDVQSHQLIVTTHSPIIIEESSYENIVISADHIFFCPNETDVRRNEINTAFLSGFGAEMVRPASWTTCKTPCA